MYFDKLRENNSTFREKGAIMNTSEEDQLQAELREIDIELKRITEEQPRLEKSASQYSLAYWLILAVVVVLNFIDLLGGPDTTNINWTLFGIQCCMLTYESTVGATGRMRRNARKSRRHLERDVESRNPCLIEGVIMPSGVLGLRSALQAISLSLFLY